MGRRCPEAVSFEPNVIALETTGRAISCRIDQGGTQLVAWLADLATVKLIYRNPCEDPTLALDRSKARGCTHTCHVPFHPHTRSLWIARTTGRSRESQKFGQRRKECGSEQSRELMGQPSLQRFRERSSQTQPTLPLLYQDLENACVQNKNFCKLQNCNRKQPPWQNVSSGYAPCVCQLCTAWL